MDISKYLTNKDIQLSNEDFNLEKLEKDIRKGYVLESDKEQAIKEKYLLYQDTSYGV